MLPQIHREHEGTSPDNACVSAVAVATWNDRPLRTRRTAESRSIARAVSARFPTASGLVLSSQWSSQLIKSKSLRILLCNARIWKKERSSEVRWFSANARKFFLASISFLPRPVKQPVCCVLPVRSLQSAFMCFFARFSWHSRPRVHHRRHFGGDHGHHGVEILIEGDPPWLQVDIDDLRAARPAISSPCSNIASALRTISYMY